MQRIESTPEYKAEFERLIAAAGKAEKAYEVAKAERERCERALVEHIESRHYDPARYHA